LPYFFRSNCFGLSQYGLLHFGQTVGRTAVCLGNHSWPQRQRQPVRGTIPKGNSGFFVIRTSLLGIYQKYIPNSLDPSTN